MGQVTTVELTEGAVIGLPRALLFYELYPFWRAFFEELGFKVADSGSTSRGIIEAGTKGAADEACLPVKAFYGHVMALREKVDAIFLPRLVSLREGTYTCPKLLGLPDMVRHNVGRLPRLVVTDVDESRKGSGLASAALGLALRLGRARSRARAAVAAALEALASFRSRLRAGLPFEEAVGWRTGPRPPGPPGSERSIRVGLIGHAYNLFDDGANLGLVGRLTALGCDVVTSESLSDEKVDLESAALPKEIFWGSGRRLLAAATCFRRERTVDGVIHVVCFGCGPDSMVGEIAERETRRESDLPYMVLTIDEHSSEVGLETRLEAFVDMLERRRAAAGRVQAARAGAGPGTGRGA